MADPDSSKSETSVPDKLPKPDPGDGDLEWVKELSEEARLAYFQERVSWQQARVKFNAADKAAEEAKAQPQTSFDSLKEQYKNARNARTEAMTAVATLKGKIESALKDLDAGQADEVETTGDWIRKLQDAIQDYAKQAAEAVRAKTALDQAQAALSAAGDPKNQKPFNYDTIKLNGDVEAKAKSDYDQALAAAAAQMNSAKQRFVDKQKELKAQRPG